MVNKMRGPWGIITLLCFIAVLSTAAKGQQVAQKGGYGLLDSLSQIFFDMGRSGTWDLQRINQSITNLMAEARQAREKNQIDRLFFARYQRLLGIIKMTAGPDPDGILVPIINRELTDFVNEVLAEEFKASGPEGIQQVAIAIRDEIINLQLYLDNLAKKEKLIKEWNEKISNLK